jgi:hypothetical protein
VSVTATRDRSAARGTFVPSTRNAAHCVVCERELEDAEVLWLIDGFFRPANFRYFCRACAREYVERFRQQYWVWISGDRFPVVSACPKCKRPMLLYGPYFGHRCNCGPDAEPDEGHADGFGWGLTFYNCRRCGKPYSGRRPGFDCAPCSERCRKALYRKRGVAGTHTCGACGEEFTAPRSDAHYCSNACRQKAYRKREEAA